MTGSTRSSDGLDDRRKRLLSLLASRHPRDGSHSRRFADAEIAGLADDELAQLERLIEVPRSRLLCRADGNGPLTPEYAAPVRPNQVVRAVDHFA